PSSTWPAADIPTCTAATWRFGGDGSLEADGGLGAAQATKVESARRSAAREVTSSLDGRGGGIFEERLRGPSLSRPPSPALRPPAGEGRFAFGVSRRGGGCGR